MFANCFIFAVSCSSADKDMGEQKKHIDIKQHNNDLQFIKYTYYTLSDIDGFLSHLLNKKKAT